jgi:HNH endonuclease
MSVPPQTRHRVRQRANFLCEYCHSSEEASTALFTLDHLIPQSLGGSDADENLALACHRCNSRRYNFTTAIDPLTQVSVPLFDPRKDEWSEHFIWSADGVRIIGITPIGRATCDRLDLNDDRHDEGSICKARRLWMRGGWHPPANDPKQSDDR